MTQNSSQSSKIAINTILLYARMVFVTVINLFSVRIVLKSLGTEDYGIFNVVVGIVTMFNCVSSVLATTTQRFYSIRIRLHETEKLREIFAASMNLYILMSVVVIILGESIGLWFLNTYLNIPPNRIIAANWIYQFSIFSFAFTLLYAPYLSSIIVNEDMGIFSLISIADCFLKLIAAIITLYVNYDRLISYCGMLLFISIIILITYHIIAKYKYKECRYKRVTNKSLYKQIGSFSLWTLVGSLASVGMNQVNTILINIFFGPITNASRAVAMQVNTAITSLSANFITAARPAMISTYASGDYEYLNRLFSLSNKFIYYFLLIILVPIFINAEYVLSWWLGTSQGQTTLFVRLIIIYAFILSLNNPISIIIQAIGRVKQYYLAVEIFTIACPVVTYFLFRSGYEASTSFVAMIFAVILSHIIRVICLKHYYHSFKIKTYFSNFLLPAMMISGIVIFINYKIFFLDINPIWRILAQFFISAVTTLVLTFFLGLSQQERKSILTLLKSKIPHHA